jgi:hypothetical protein
VWSTAEGNRVLVGAERALFTRAAASLAGSDQPTGVRLVDRLGLAGRVVLLAGVARALTRRKGPVKPHLPVEKAAVYAVFRHVTGLVRWEIVARKGIDEPGCWRGMVLAAWREGPWCEEWQEPAAGDVAAWEELVDSLAALILWDCKWLEEEYIASLPPLRAAVVRQMARREDDYDHDFDDNLRDASEAEAMKARAYLQRLADSSAV